MKSDSPTALELPSKITGTTYKLHLPNHLPTSTAKSPVPLVLVMDGDDQFKFAEAAYEKLRSSKSLPPLLLVGIGYGASYQSKNNRRMRDYTPTAMKGEEGTGGAEAFLQALRDEIIPFLEARYGSDPSQRGIAGHSLGSLFALYAFFQDRPLFPRCLASAPSIWYDDRSLLKLEAEFASRHRVLPGRLFLSVGEEDSPSMLGDLELLENVLDARPYANLTVTQRRFAGRDHYNVLPDAFGEGLVALYGTA